MLFYKKEVLVDALACKFDKFNFIKGYEGIWSNELNIIEVEISSLNISSRFFLDKLNRIINKPNENEDNVDDEDITNIILPSVNNFQISIGICSDEFTLLSNSREQGPRGRNMRRITLQIKNLSINTHDMSLDILEKIANSIFFQIDLAFEFPINLQTQRESWIDRRNKRMRKQMFVDETATINEPKYEYDSEPIALYWYAKESVQMPIFQYLAFYQTVEFYFPIYSSFEAKQKIQSLIKDPRFNPNKDSDITKIISTIKLSGSNKSFGSEREQLKATISAATNNVELNEFFNADKNRFDFYSENKGNKISEQKISVKNKTADLVSEISERIYQIRCRIVHSKSSDGNFDVLLPYSNEVKKLNFDIELIEFISRKILITSSRPLKV